MLHHWGAVQSPLLHYSGGWEEGRSRKSRRENHRERKVWNIDGKLWIKTGAHIYSWCWQLNIWGQEKVPVDSVRILSLYEIWQTENPFSRTFLWPFLSLLSLPVQIGHKVMSIYSCQRFNVWWLRLTSIRFFGIIMNMPLALEKSILVSVCVSVNIFTYTQHFSHWDIFSFWMSWAIILLYLEFLMVLHWMQICQSLVFPSPRWVRSQWYNQLWSTKKRKREHGTKSNTKKRGKRQVGGWGNEKDKPDDVGSRIIYLSVGVCYYTFSMCVPGNGGDKKTLCVTSLLPYSLDFVYVPLECPICNL